MNIKIILKQPYPNGMACTNRVHHYARGLQEQGHQVEIIIPIPLEDPADVKNEVSRGQYEGIDFSYAGGTTTRSRSFFGRRIHDALAPLKAAFHIRSQSEKPDAILLVSTYFYHIALFKIVALLTSAIYLHERSEFPFVFKKKSSFFHTFYKKIHSLLAHHCFDGIFVISNSLRAYYAERVGRSTQLLLVPIIVDIQEFQQRDDSAEKYLAYAGNLSDMKDGMSTLINAFRIIHQQCTDLKLYLIGGGASSDRQKTEELIKKYGLQDSILLTGYVSRAQLIYYLSNAEVLVLAKPDNVQSAFCFPSKLGEYLATGNPVVTTNVGEIPTYLTDRQDAFLAQADNPDDFAQRVLEAMADSGRAREVGKQGKATASQQFDYRSQGERISSFIYTLSEVKYSRG